MALTQIAVAYAKSGNMKEALQIAASVVDDYWKPIVYRWIAKTQASHGDEKKAVAWIDKQESLVVKLYALLGVAEGILDKQTRPGHPNTRVVNQ